MNNPVFATLNEAFLYCRDMDASLQERLEAFSEATRYLIPGYQEAVDRMVDRQTQFDAGHGAPKPGEAMPPFAMPDEKGQLVTLDELLMKGPVAITFHRGHWCPYCRINTRALAKAQTRIASSSSLSSPASFTPSWLILSQLQSSSTSFPISATTSTAQRAVGPTPSRSRQETHFLQRRYPQSLMPLLSQIDRFFSSLGTIRLVTERAVEIGGGVAASLSSLSPGMR